MNRRLQVLLDQKHLMDCELEEIEEMEEVIKIEDNGMSVLYCGSHWYSVYIKDFQYQVYVY